MSFVRRISLVVVLVLVVTTVAGTVNAQTPDLAREVRAQGQPPTDICANADTSEPETRDYDQAENVLQDGVDYWAVLCTEAGPVVIDLYETEAPITVNNFVFLAQNGFYNNTTFHRVLNAFMAQGGDPTGTGSGGPGYTFEDETDNGLGFDQIGLLAMANAGANTNGSQFFITYVKTTWLDGNHTIFGRVFSGMDHVELLTLRDPDQGPTFAGARLDTVVILEGADALDVAPDAAPSPEHFAAVMKQNIGAQLNLFELDEARSGVYDLDAAAAAWSAGGDDLVDFMRAQLSDSGFAGSGGIWLSLGECAENPGDGPVWEIGLRVTDFGADGSAAVIFNDDRTAQIIASGAFTSYTDLPDETGRIYEGGQGSTLCGDTGVLYHFEFPYARYMLTVTLVVDSTVVNPDSETPADQYLFYVMQEFVINRIAGVLDRGLGMLDE